MNIIKTSDYNNTTGNLLQNVLITFVLRKNNFKYILRKVCGRIVHC